MHPQSVIHAKNSMKVPRIIYTIKDGIKKIVDDRNQVQEDWKRDREDGTGSYYDSTDTVKKRHPERYSRKVNNQ